MLIVHFPRFTIIIIIIILMSFSICNAFSCMQVHGILLSIPLIFVLSFSITIIISYFSARYLLVDFDSSFVSGVTAPDIQYANIFHYSEFRNKILLFIIIYTQKKLKKGIISHVSLVAEWNEKRRSFKIIIIEFHIANFDFIFIIQSLPIKWLRICVFRIYITLLWLGIVNCEWHTVHDAEQVSYGEMH